MTPGDSPDRMAKAPHPIKLAELPWPWAPVPAAGMTLTSDAALLAAAEDPDRPIEELTVRLKKPTSLREYCQAAADRGAQVLRVAYDYFYGGNARRLFPDMEEFQDALMKIGDVAAHYGLALEPSILSPLELGVGYRAKTGESGRWMQYREGLRNPRTGAYSIQLWQHQQWCNNKGPTPVELVGVRAFAFREEPTCMRGYMTVARDVPIKTGPFYAVNPEEIVELSEPKLQETPGSVLASPEHFIARRVTVSGAGDTEVGPLDRVLVVLIYRTSEMDYFSPKAAAFLEELVRSYHDRGIVLAGLYSDEIHIQQDWCYHNHLECGQFNLRYVSEEFEKAFARRFGEPYADFARYLVYFASHQHDFLPTHEPDLPSQHVLGGGLEDVHRTFLLRRNYFRFLHDGVVHLMTQAKKKLEALYGQKLMANYHSTWAESPTCDYWANDENARRYEYTPDFVWSNTVHQAAAACDDYFAWNEFLTGGNVDTPEQGFTDRNYYGRALSCSLAALNDQPLARCGMWGVPKPVRERMEAVNAVYGAGGWDGYRGVQDYAPRQTEVLCTYPLDLLAVDERFGSWVIQYGYANYITVEKLLAHGKVAGDGCLQVKGNRYKTLVLLYEPLPPLELLAMVKAFLQEGGTVVWLASPPVLDRDGQAVGAKAMRDLFGVELVRTDDPLGEALPGHVVVFEGLLSHLSPMTVLTDFCVDRIHPVKPLKSAEVIASVDGGCVGTVRRYEGGGQAAYLGFRPRDDQSASTGREARWLFEILAALGAYPPSGAFEENDNPAYVSRHGDYLVTSFANGAVAVCPHYARHKETWFGTHNRDEQRDRQTLQANPLPDDAINLEQFKAAGLSVSYTGRHAVAFRLSAEGDLSAFAGRGCEGIEINGRPWRFADQPVDIAWHPVLPAHRTVRLEALYRLRCETPGRVVYPLGLRDGRYELWLALPGHAGFGEKQVPFTLRDGGIALEVDQALCSRWMILVQRKK